MKTFNPGLSRLLGARSGKQRAPDLGQRELEVMKILWQGQAQTAQQVLQSSHEENLSLSTMQSTLERLHRKELITREKSGRSYIYRAAVSRDKIVTNLLGDIAEQLSDGNVAPMVSGFISFLDQHAPEQEILENVREAINRLPPQTDD